MSDEIARKDNNGIKEVKKAPPRPPVLPKSYTGALPKVSETQNQKQVHTDVNNAPLKSASIAKDNNISDPEVVISKEQNVLANDINSKNTAGNSYGQYNDKKGIFKALAAVLAVIFIIGGGVWFVIFRAKTSESANIKVLDKPNAGMVNLNSLSKYKSLEELRLYNSGIQNIDGIKSLKGLKVVYLRENEIKDISALKDLRDVEYLHLEGNQISDISALAGLRKLRVLYIGRNNISDLSPLADLVNLEELDLSYNNISDITPLLKLTKLRKLKLNNNQITDIKALKDMTELRDLFIRENGEINDLTPLIGMHKMEWCSFNPKNLDIEIIYQLKEANPDAIYYFFYNGQDYYTDDEIVKDPDGSKDKDKNDDTGSN